MARTIADAVAAPPVNLGRVARIPEGQGRCYVVGPHEIAIFRQRDGRLFASENRCPHRGGPLAEGLLGDGRIVCPLHARQFDLCSGTSSEPSQCLRVFAVKEVDGDILVSLDGGES